MSASRDYMSTNAMSMTDIGWNITLIFICLFALTILMVTKKQIEQEKTGVNLKSEFMISVSWHDESDTDVDTYVEDPLGNIVYFGAREKGVMHLDRDDLGYRSDAVILPDGEVLKVMENREIVMVRGIVPGEYTINIHMFRKGMREIESGQPLPVKVRLEKLNPVLKLIQEVTVDLNDNGNEVTAFRFTVDEKGAITDLNRLEKQFTGTTPTPYSEEMIDGNAAGQQEGQSP